MTQEKHLLFLFLDLFCRFFWIFFSFPPSVVVVNFTGTLKSKWRRKWQPTPVLLPGESCGWRTLVSCCLWSRTVGHYWSDLACMHAWNLIKLLSFFIFPPSVTFFTVAINLYLYIGFLLFCGVYFFFFLFSLILIFKTYYYFSTFIPLFAFHTVLFPLQLIFNVYKSSLSTSI